jgi:hypothetical protein
MPASEIRSTVTGALAATPVIDLHTHLFAPALGSLGLWGIDELVTYHYLEAELFRSSGIRPDEYWALGKQQQADAIWQALFVRNSPVSEATRGVIAVLNAFGLPTEAPDLGVAREFFRAQKLDDHIDKVFELAGVSQAVMTNDPLDPAEAPLWERGFSPDPRFLAALRIDRILNRYAEHWEALRTGGYQVERDGSGRTAGEVRRFLGAWIERMNPRYLAVSLPDSFRFPEDSVRATLIRDAVLPACRDYGIPMAMMIGVRLQVNPAIKLAGDALGRADLTALECMCREFPDNRFLVTVLSRENQHELCVYARKFGNLMPFGCWWFLNNPSIVSAMTRERIEMLGTSFIPQHSDARILEQVIYKWRSSRRVIGAALADSYELMAADGRPAGRAEIARDVHRLMRGNFETWTGRAAR